jgi:hypothetical protein
MCSSAPPLVPCTYYQDNRLQVSELPHPIPTEQYCTFLEVVDLPSVILMFRPLPTCICSGKAGANVIVPPAPPPTEIGDDEENIAAACGGGGLELGSPETNTTPRADALMSLSSDSASTLGPPTILLLRT